MGETCKARVIRALRAAGGPVPTPELVRLTGDSRAAVWDQLVRLRRLGVVEAYYRRGTRPRRWGLRPGGVT